MAEPDDPIQAALEAFSAALVDIAALLADFERNLAAMTQPDPVTVAVSFDRLAGNLDEGAATARKVAAMLRQVYGE